MRIAKPLIVQQHFDAGDAGTRQRPAFDGQPSGDRLNSRAGSDNRTIDLQAEVLRGWWWRLRFSSFDQDGAGLLPRVVEPIAYDDENLVLTRRHITQCLV